MTLSNLCCEKGLDFRFLFADRAGMNPEIKQRLTNPNKVAQWRHSPPEAVILSMPFMMQKSPCMQEGIF